MRSGALRLFLVTLLFSGCGHEEFGGSPSESSQLPLPSTLSREEFQTAFYKFLDSFQYRELGWKRDKTIRDTGAWLNGRYSGTHPAVRLYYSPEVIEWLENGRQGELPDGAVIIKEMYEPPAARYEGVADSTLPHQWTVMIKDRGGQTPDGMDGTGRITTPILRASNPLFPRPWTTISFPSLIPIPILGSRGL